LRSSNVTVDPVSWSMGSSCPCQMRSSSRRKVREADLERRAAATAVDVEEFSLLAHRPVNCGGWNFDIAAKASAPATRDELQAMLRTLLAERFRLTVHTETRSEPIWALVLARRDGKLGPNLHPAANSCVELRAGWQAKAPGEHDPCGTWTFVNALRTGSMSVHGFALDQLSALSTDVGRRPFVNKTGLAGFYDWDLTWTPQVFLQAPFDRSRFPDINPDGPSAFTALEEQLGLKLESQKGDAPVLVIDHIERPTEN
jgi:uncharacterized protein (TIGR03435 family)